jgi:NADH:ubiquinone reductase (H+-translocating)
MVEQDLTVPEHPEIFVNGDVAHARGPGGNPPPGAATAAMSRAVMSPACCATDWWAFEPNLLNIKTAVNMAMIGRAAAVADFGRVRLAEFGDWLMRLFVH